MLRKSNRWFQGYLAARKTPNSSSYVQIANEAVLFDQLDITTCPIRDKLSCFNNYDANYILERTYKIAAHRCSIAVLKNFSKSAGIYLPQSSAVSCRLACHFNKTRTQWVLLSSDFNKKLSEQNCYLPPGGVC